MVGGVQAMSKDLLYGTLDGTTLEWTDGVFTATLRQVLATHITVFDPCQALIQSGASGRSGGACRLFWSWC